MSKSLYQQEKRLKDQIGPITKHPLNDSDDLEILKQRCWNRKGFVH